MTKTQIIAIKKRKGTSLQIDFIERFAKEWDAAVENAKKSGADLSKILEYDAEKDCYIVAEGWYESVSFADEFNRIVDETVIAWRPIMEPYQAGNY